MTRDEPTSVSQLSELIEEVAKKAEDPGNLVES